MGTGKFAPERIYGEAPDGRTVLLYAKGAELRPADVHLAGGPVDEPEPVEADEPAGDPFEGLTKAELVELAAERFGLELSMSDPKAKLLAAIRQAAAEQED